MKLYPLVLFLFNWMLSSCSDNEIPASETWPQASYGITDATINTTGDFAIVAGFDEPAGWWDLKTNARLFNWSQSQDSADQSSAPIQLTAISPDSSRALTANNKSFVIWNTQTGKSAGYYSSPTNIRDVAISNGAQYVLLALSDGRAYVVSMRSKRRLEFYGHQNHMIAQGIPKEYIGINSADISANGRYALTGGDDHFAILWDTQTGQVVQQFPHPSRVTLVKFSADGSLAFTAGNNADAYIWKTTTGEKVATLQLKPREYILSSAKFSPDNRWLSTGAPSRILSLWNTVDGSLIKTWRVKKRFKNKANGAVVLDTGFDGQYLISESSSGFGQKWQLPSASTSTNKETEANTNSEQKPEDSQTQ